MLMNVIDHVPGVRPRAGAVDRPADWPAATATN